MFTIVDLLCESRVRVTVSLGASLVIGTSLTGLEGFDPIFPADAALFHTTPRRAWVITVVGVYPDQASLDLCGKAMGFTDILRPQTRSETVLARVGQKQTFRFFLLHQSSISWVSRGNWW